MRLFWLTLTCSGFLLASGLSARTDEFLSNGVRIYYTVHGSGEPVILIHGLYSDARTNWEMPGIVRELAKEYQVIALDNRGHGDSEKPQEDGKYGPEMAEDIVRLMDHLHIAKAHVVGYSLGGMITMKLLTMHPDRVSSAILGGMGWLKTGSPGQRFWEKMHGNVDAPVPSACLRGMAQLAVSESEVKAIHVPVTVIVGETDPCRRMFVEPLQAIRPDWPVTVVNGVGHLICVIKPEFKAQIKADLEARPTKKR